MLWILESDNWMRNSKTCVGILQNDPRTTPSDIVRSWTRVWARQWCVQSLGPPYPPSRPSRSHVYRSASNSTTSFRLVTGSGCGRQINKPSEALPFTCLVETSHLCQEPVLESRYVPICIMNWVLCRVDSIRLAVLLEGLSVQSWLRA